MRFTGMVAIALAMTAAPAQAQSMNAESFYKKAMALKSKGKLAALVSRDLKILVNEARAAGLKARANRVAAAAKGLKPRYCPPPGAKRLGHEEFLSGMARIPAAERIRIDMLEAMNRVMAAKFPCRG
jgi:hypothetical protein